MDGWWHPPTTADAAEFVAALRELRTRTGLSYRVLERRAAQAGDVLPSSTLNTALTRRTPPSEQVLRAFLRACGAEPDVVERWVAARADLVAEHPAPVDAEPVEPAVQPEPEPHPQPEAGSNSGTSRRRFALVASVIALAVLAGMLIALAPGWDRDTPAPDAGPTAESSLRATVEKVDFMPTTTTAPTTTRTTPDRKPTTRITTTTTTGPGQPLPLPEPVPGEEPDPDWPPYDTWNPTTTTTTNTRTIPPETSIGGGTNPGPRCEPPPSNVCVIG
jgi:lambda repressor-like predicted transcriptional regulator